MGTRTRRWLKRIGIVVAVVLVLVAASLWWLLGTRAGLQFALDRAHTATNGALTVGSAQGDLAGPMQLKDVRYRDPQAGIDVQVGHLDANLAVWSLLVGKVRLAALDAGNIHVALTTTANKTEPESSEPVSLQAPINMAVDHAHIGKTRITQDGQPVFALNRLDLAASWTSRGFVIRQLDLKAPDGQAKLQGTLALAPGVRGQGHGSFQWQINDNTWAGTLKAHSNGKLASLDLQLAQPVKATVHLNAKQKPSWPWTATLKAPRFDTAPLLGDSSLRTLALDLAGHGDRHGCTLTGQVQLNQTRLALQPLELHYHPEKHTVTLDRLLLTSPNIQGQLAGHGTLDLSASPATAKLALDWNDVLLPASLVGQTLASSGQLRVQGSSESYQASGQLRVGPPDQLAQLNLDLTGSTEQITLKHLTITQPKGKLDTRGTLTLSPQLAWDLRIQGQHFNPGLMLADWPGALDADLATQGRLTPKGPEAKLAIHKLQGTLRQHTVYGQGTLHITPQRVLNGNLNLASGQSRISVAAHGTQRNHLQLNLTIPTLGDWLPDASGSVHGKITAEGLWPRLSASAHVEGQQLQLGTRHADQLSVDAEVADLARPDGKLTLQAKNLAADGMRFASLALSADGDIKQHALKLTASGQPLSLQLALTGTTQNEVWTGSLSTLDLALTDQPGWKLAAPTTLVWDHGRAELDHTCLRAATSQICLAAQRTRTGDMTASYRLQQVPIALITAFTGNGLPLVGNGVINGQGNLARSASSQLSGHASLDAPAGNIHYSDRPDLPLLAWEQIHAEANLAAHDQKLTLAAKFSHGGHLDGNIHLQGPQQSLSGHISARMDNLAPVQLFTSELANIQGHLDADFRLAGNLAEPVITGHAQLQQFAAEVPALGLKLHDGQVDVSTTHARQLQLKATLGSGKGQLAVTGTLALAGDAGTQLSIRGDQVLAADIPAAKVTVSPDLTVVHDAQGLAITGQLAIDRANIKLEQLPGAGATEASPDVVIVDAEKKTEKNAPLAIRADITVSLGEHTQLVGYGLDGSASGKLEVHQVPGKPVIGRGQIIINGTYKAYGQDLVIEQGRLLFASTPIDNPGLAIRAVRQLNPNATINDGQVVGLHITGTARRPIMTVFSNPAMDTSDALSYLITGKPLSAVKGGEGSMVSAAAQALGSAAGDLLAKGIGSKLGIEAGVSSNAALGTTAFTVGKYLSPRLYLSYGVGLFDPGEVITLRYILSRRWNFEAQQATTFSRASFNYRLEH